MELVGEEKRIRALFSELRLGDEQLMPGFAVTRNRAQSRIIRPSRGLRLSLVTASALVISAATIGSLAWWSRGWQTRRQPTVQTSMTSAIPGVSPEVAKNPAERRAVPIRHRRSPSATVRAMKLAVRRRAEMLTTEVADKKAIQDSIAISKWESPTAVLMLSSSRAVLTSLPQLDESARDLKTFLPGGLN